MKLILPFQVKLADRQTLSTYTTGQRLMPETRWENYLHTNWYELPKQDGFTNNYSRPLINARNQTGKLSILPEKKVPD